MQSANPIQAALKDQGLTMGILKREGLPLLREGKLAEHIKKIPGSDFLVSQVENYVNSKATVDVTSPAANTSTTAAATTPTKVGNPFPPLKPR